MSASPSLLIFGGAGFLGQRIAQSAITKGWQVTSITRSGSAPKLEDKSQSSRWLDQVRWIKGDAFDQSSYADELAKVNHVISTIGILDYRGIRKQDSLRKRVDALGSTFYDAVQELLPSASAPTESDPALEIYDRLNRDSLKAIADTVYNVTATSVKHKLESFAYVSAAEGFPGIPKRYITSKREAEQYLLTKAAERNAIQSAHPLRTIIYRPGFMYAESSPLLSTLSHVLGASYALNNSLEISQKLSKLTNGTLSLGAAGVKPLPVTRVADALIEGCALADGILDVYKIEALADVRWRADMLK